MGGCEKFLLNVYLFCEKVSRSLTHDTVALEKKQDDREKISKNLFISFFKPKGKNK